MEVIAANQGTESHPEQLLARVQDLQEALEASGEMVPRGLAEDLVSSVVQMYGLGLERILAAVQDAPGSAEEAIAQALAQDEFVAMLLLIHDLHPVPLADRVQAALDSVRPYMESHGGNVELLSLENGVARIHLRGSCSDCSASSVTLELAIKQALEEAAPDLVGLEVEGMAPQSTDAPGLPMATGSAPPSGMELPVVAGPPAAPPSWFEVESVAGLENGGLAAIDVAGQDLVVANVDGTLLAYHDACASCGAALRGGTLSAGALACPGCGRSFFLPRAGRSMDDERIQLVPVPLLREQGRVRVAVSS